MTIEQIKGCQTLAEVEGLKLSERHTQASDMPLTFIDPKDPFKCNHFRDYLHDWNDLLRVSRILFSTPVSEGNDFEQLVAREERFFTWVSLYNKSEAFSVLVEAAEWIKQQE